MFISGTDIDNCNRALTIVKTIVEDPEVGAIYKGRVTRLMDFGAFVEIAPGKEGLVHISRLDVKRTEKVTDVVNVDDEVLVKVLEIDDKGRLNLSRRDAPHRGGGPDPGKRDLRRSPPSQKGRPERLQRVPAQQQPVPQLSGLKKLDQRGSGRRKEKRGFRSFAAGGSLRIFRRPVPGAG